MNSIRRAGIMLALIGLAAWVTACAPPPSPPPDTNLYHLTVWQADVTYPDTQPDIVDWVGYGSFVYNDGLGGCNLVDGGAGFSESFVRLDPNTVRVTLTLDWIEGENGIDPYGCGVQPELSVGLLDGLGNEVAQPQVPLLSHT